jgi:hypothetical protein
MNDIDIELANASSEVPRGYDKRGMSWIDLLMYATFVAFFFRPCDHGVYRVTGPADLAYLGTGFCLSVWLWFSNPGRIRKNCQMGRDADPEP